MSLAVIGGWSTGSATDIIHFIWNSILSVVNSLELGSDDHPQGDMKELQSKEEDSGGDSCQVSVRVPENEEYRNESTNNVNYHQECPWQEKPLVVAAKSDEKDN